LASVMTENNRELARFDRRESAEREGVEFRFNV
jgi:hypothetical protein